jgi:hypothetical protein
VKGARITVKCDCGELNYLEYGEQWECPRCGRRWNTAQIPADEYWGVMRQMRGFRIRAMMTALALGGGFAILAVTVSWSFFLLLPVFMSAWYLFYMPRWRQRVRRQARATPQWELHPE